MIKGLCALVCISLLLVAQCQTFRKIPLDNGRVSVRNLEGASNKASFQTAFAPDNAAISVKTSDAFRAAHEVKAENTTDFILMISNAATGFCSNCEEFQKVKCEEGFCTANTEDTALRVNGPFLYFQSSKAVSTELKIGTNWELKTKAALFESFYRTIPSSYVTNKNSFGFIGLGADGDAYNNFLGDHPLFSIKTDRYGKGELIFGNDNSQYDASKKPQVIKTTGNWTAITKNITFGPTVNKTTYNTKLIFDLNVEGLYLDYSGSGDALTLIRNQLIKLKAWSNGTYYYYNGSLTALPDIEIGITEDQVLKIPPHAYSRPVANMPGYYEILLLSSPSFYDYEGGKTGNSIYTTVIGRTILSQFYTIFEAPKDKAQSPTVTFYSTPTAAPSVETKGGNGLMWVIALVAIGAVGYFVFKNKAANSLKEHLNSSK
jgi:hypothetical protein